MMLERKSSVGSLNCVSYKHNSNMGGSVFNITKFKASKFIKKFKASKLDSVCVRFLQGLRAIMMALI